MYMLVYMCGVVFITSSMYPWSQCVVLTKMTRILKFKLLVLKKVLLANRRDQFAIITWLHVSNSNQVSISNGLLLIRT